MRTLRLAGLGVALAVLIAYPLVITDALYAEFGVLTLLFVAWAVAWNMFSGYSGYISLGHAVFFGTGAYAVGLLTEHLHLTGGQIFWLLPLGGVAGAAVAVPFGLIALRVRRHTFVVITIAVFFIFQLMAYNFSFTGGNSGLSTPTFFWSPATYNNPFYYAALILAVGTVVLSWLVRGSRFGLQLLAIRDDEDRARGLGVRAMRVKLSAFVISAAITGVVGALWWFLIGQALPNTVFNPAFDLSDRADGLPRRIRHTRRADPGRADPGAAAAVCHDHVHQRVPRRDRPGLAVPAGDPLPAARDHPHRARAADRLATLAETTGPAGARHQRGRGHGRAAAGPVSPALGRHATGTPSAGSVR